MNIDRMKEAIAVLRKVQFHEGELDNRRFDYSIWRCGTAACAGGFLCLHQPFIDQGLLMFNNVPLYEDESGASALGLFLDLDQEQATNAFLDMDCVLSLKHNLRVAVTDVTAGDVADYLQTLLDEETT